MHQDGDSDKEHKAQLSGKIKRYEAALQALDPEVDQNAIKLCNEVIADAKQELIQMNSPQDQLRNLRSALSRKQALSDHLASQISLMMEDLDSVKQEITQMKDREVVLIGMITMTPVQTTQSAGMEAQLQELQQQFTAMQYNFQLEKEQWHRQLSEAQSVQGCPDDVKKLLPVIIPPTPFLSPAPGTPLQPLQPPQFQATAPPPPAMPTGFEPINGDDLDDLYGPVFGPAQARSSPYLSQEAVAFSGEASRESPPG